MGEHNTPLEVIIWDWNGTLLNDVDIAISSMNVLLERYNLPKLTKSIYRQKFQFPVEKYYKKLGFNFDQTPFSLLAQEFIDEYYQQLPDSAIYCDVRDILNKIQKHGIKQYILSAMEQFALENSVESQGIYHHFEGIYGIRDIMGRNKNTKGKELIKTEGINPQNAILIGDTLHDFELAENLNCQHILLSIGHQDYLRLSKISSNIAMDHTQIMKMLMELF